MDILCKIGSVEQISTDHNLITVVANFMKPLLIITGASRGIGHAIAQNFHRNQWDTLNIARTQNALADCTHIQIDLTNPTFTNNLEKQLRSILIAKQRICLVHNASMHVNDSVIQQNPDTLTNALNVSIVSSSILNRILIPHMAENSSIIYIGSTLSEKAVPNAATYVITKHAVVGMMRATCQDLAKKNIHTACVCPGFTNTEMLQTHLNHDPDLMAFAKNKVGAQRLIEPDEIANVVYFAALNPVINGAVIHAHLGQIES
jgi:3-oxoacyl-[acyl-carrier protein] reductase